MGGPWGAKGDAWGGCGGFGPMGMGKGGPWDGGCKGFGGFGPMGMGKGGCFGMMGGKGMMKGYGPAMACGGYGGGQQKPAKQAPPPAAHVEVSWLTLKQDSQITGEGFPPEAPALSYDKTATIFSSAHGILQELVSDIGSEVQFVHDPDWEQFPEVGEALKEAGLGDNCFGIATCPNEGKWGIGLGSGWQGRERACKAALALSIAAGNERMDKLAHQYPEFRALCMDAGLMPGKPPARGAMELGDLGMKKSGKGGGQDAAAAAMAAMPTEQVPAVTWLTVETNSKLTEAGFPTDGPAVGHDKAYAEAFKVAHQILGELVEGGDVQGSVQFTHDADWTEFPEIGKAITAAGAEETCYCLATCPSAGKWAVGLAAGWKARETACKLALCLSLASDEETFTRLCQEYPVFGAFCSSAGLMVGGGAVTLDTSKQQKRKADDDGAQVTKAAKKNGGVGKPNGKAVNIETTGTPPPTDTALWIQLSSGKLPDVLKGMPGECLVVGNDGTTRKALYNTIDQVLTHLVSDPKADVQYIDDPLWEQFSEVGEALKVYGESKDPTAVGPRSMEEQLAIAVCPSAEIWAAGFGAKANNRKQAAKVALAAALMQKQAEAGEMPDLSAYPPFSEFIAEITKLP